MYAVSRLGNMVPGGNMLENRPSRGEVRSALEQLFPAGQVKVAEEVQVGDQRVDYEAWVKLGRRRLKLLVEYKDVLSEARLKEAVELLRGRQARRPSDLWVFAAPFLSPSRQNLLRERGVPFFDFAGNAWITGDATHIDRRGFSNPLLEQRRSRGPFSDKASLVLRSLISSGPGRGVRSIAEEAGLSPGYVSKVVQELERRGYVAGQELLQDWVGAYRKRSVETRSYFVSATSAKAVMDMMKQSLHLAAGEYALTMQAGASLVVPYADFDSVDVYVRETEVAEAMARDLNAWEVQRGANLRISLPYYRISAFFGRQEVGGLSLVSDLQLYLDLYDYPLRGREQAEHLFERRLGPKLAAAERV